jgi:hypothetical protein
MLSLKHHLTSGADHLTGINGKDLFLAPLVKSGGHLKPTLTSADVLDGGAGIDTISAFITDLKIAPHLENIERGIFKHGAGTLSTLDLAHASDLTDITIVGVGLTSDVTVDHAAHLSKITVHNEAAPGTIQFNAIDASAVKNEVISFDAVFEKTVVLNSKGSEEFHNLDISLKNSDYEKLAGDISASTMEIHSLGVNDNYLGLDASKSTHSVDDLTVSGHAKLMLDFGTTSEGFDKLIKFDASTNTGGVSAAFHSSRLKSIAGSEGNDIFYLYDIGGTKSSHAKAELGAGDDLLGFVKLALKPATMHFDGGDGTDVASIEGNQAHLSKLFSNFETLSVQGAKGTYSLGAEWTSITFGSAVAQTDNVDIHSGANLSSVQGSWYDDYIQLDTLHGSSGHKATVDLDMGNDFINLNSMSLDYSTQTFYGGDGHDGFSVSGNVAFLSTLFHDFEYAYLYNATGAYDFTGTGIGGVIFASIPAAATTFDYIESGALVQIQGTQTSTLTVNVDHAASLTTDSFKVELYNAATLGSGFGGFSAVGLSNLEIYGTNSDHVVYLGQIGSTTDYATLKLSGDQHMTVNAVIGSSSYIDYVNITNTAGVDMLGLLNGTKALSSFGVNIDGGSGGDTLVGGSGADIINSGGGNNEIHGSLGADQINLLLNSGADVLVFASATQSAYGSGDSVAHFNTADAIDISAVVTSITSAGDVSSFATGLSSLSTSHSVAFLDTANDTLFIDVNHDGQITSGQDMEITLTGFSGLQSWNLIG